MIEENITFSGQEAEKLTDKAIKSLRVYSIDDIAQISHNVDKEKFIQALGLVENSTIESKNPCLFGVPVYVKKYIPLGEIWLQNRDGKVIKKFSIRS